MLYWIWFSYIEFSNYVIYERGLYMVERKQRISDELEDLLNRRRTYLFAFAFKETHDVQFAEWIMTVFFARLKKWNCIDKVINNQYEIKILMTLFKMTIRMDQSFKKRKHRKINYLSENMDIHEIVTFESLGEKLTRLDHEKLIGCLNMLPSWYIDLLFLVLNCNFSIDELASVLNQKKSILKYSFNQGNILLQEYSYNIN